MMKTLRHRKSWTDEYSASTGTYKASYVTPTPDKLSAGSDELERLVKSRKAKRILDAGAGSCTLEGELLRKGYLPHLHNYLAFGAYDGSMIRICAECGSISFQHNWFIPLPICASCKYDLILQFWGVHHIQNHQDRITFLENLLGHLDCGGLLFLTEGGKKGWRKQLRVALEPWEKSKKVTRKEGNGKNGISIYRTC